MACEEYEPRQVEAWDDRQSAFVKVLIPGAATTGQTNTLDFVAPYHLINQDDKVLDFTTVGGGGKRFVYFINWTKAEAVAQEEADLGEGIVYIANAYDNIVMSVSRIEPIERKASDDFGI